MLIWLIVHVITQRCTIYGFKQVILKQHVLKSINILFFRYSFLSIYKAKKNYPTAHVQENI